MVAGYAGVTNWGDFNALLTRLSVRNPACCEQRVRHARCDVCDNASIVCNISEQIVG